MHRLAIILFLLFALADKTHAQELGPLRITRSTYKKEFCLYYHFHGIDHVVYLTYPFTDSAILTNGILFKDHDSISERAIVTFGDIIFFTACDINAPNKKVLFCIDRKRNRNVPISSGSSYLETGLPAFLISADRTVAVSGPLPFAKSKMETVQFRYFHIGHDSMKIQTKKAIKMTHAQATNLDSLEAPKFLRRIFSHGATPKLQQVDDKITSYKNDIDELSSYQNPTFFDSIRAYNDRLSNYLQQVCNNISATIASPFPSSAANDMYMYRSVDKKLRIYSWNSHENADGLAQFVRTVVQFRTGKNTRAIDNDSKGENEWTPNGLVEDIKTMQVRGKTVYLVSDNFVDLPEDQHFWLTAVVIEKGHLVEFRLFKSGGKTESQISYDHAPTPPNDDDHDHDKPEPTLHFSKDLHTIYVPITDDNLVPTGKFYTYKFNGAFFVH